MKKTTVAILLFDDVEVLDFAGPFEVFSRVRLEPGIESRRSDRTAPYFVITIAKEKKPVRATGGLIVSPLYAYADAPNIDLLVVPGGFGSRALLGDEATLAWIRDCAESGALMTSVCTGALVLARAGLLARRRATTHWGALDVLAELDPSVIVQRRSRVVVDEIVTSAGVAAGLDMAFALVEQQWGREVADETARYIEYSRTRVT